eukprot:746948-Hanusia_phi.AAC.3
MKPMIRRIQGSEERRPPEGWVVIALKGGWSTQVDSLVGPGQSEGEEGGYVFGAVRVGGVGVGREGRGMSAGSDRCDPRDVRSSRRNRRGRGRSECSGRESSEDR